MAFTDGDCGEGKRFGSVVAAADAAAADGSRSFEGTVGESMSVPDVAAKARDKLVDRDEIAGLRLTPAGPGRLLLAEPEPYADDEAADEG